MRMINFVLNGIGILKFAYVAVLEQSLMPLAFVPLSVTFVKPSLK